MNPDEWVQIRAIIRRSLANSRHLDDWLASLTREEATRLVHVLAAEMFTAEQSLARALDYPYGEGDAYALRETGRKTLDMLARHASSTIAQTQVHE
jgi:hypothetical protein